jgi:hypothetical protein
MVLRGGTTTSQHHAPETNDTDDRGGTLSSRTISQMIKGYFHKPLDRLLGRSGHHLVEYPGTGTSD